MRINTLGKVLIGTAVASALLNKKESSGSGCMGCLMAMAVAGVACFVAMAGLWAFISSLF